MPALWAAPCPTRLPQVTQQRLEGLGLVFASRAAHFTGAEAWRATGPISMARQVVAAVNQQLAELAGRKAELQHELGAAKERWQAEEGVRIRCAFRWAAYLELAPVLWLPVLPPGHCPTSDVPDVPSALPECLQAAGAAAGGACPGVQAGEGAGGA